MLSPIKGPTGSPLAVDGSWEAVTLPATFCGRCRRDSPFVPTPVAADTEVFVDRIWGIALMTAALSCGRWNKERRFYLPEAAEHVTEQVTPPPSESSQNNKSRILPHDEIKQRLQWCFKDSAHPLHCKRELTSPSDGDNTRNRAVKHVFICCQSEGESRKRFTSSRFIEPQWLDSTVTSSINYLSCEY